MADLSEVVAAPVAPPEPKVFAVLDGAKRPVGFYLEGAGSVIPADAVEITSAEHAELLNKQAGAVLDVAKDKGARVVDVVVPPYVPPSAAQVVAAELDRSPLLAALVAELAGRFGVTRAAFVASLNAKVV